MKTVLPRLLAVSDRLRLPGGDLEVWLEGLPAGGVLAVQLREKDLDDRALFELVARARRLLPPATPLVVNGRLDLALAAGAQGVHLPSDGAPVAPLRRHFGDRVLIGRSTHRAEEVAEAAAQGADYAVFGPVYPTPGKERWGPPKGLEGLARASRYGIPVYALGGIGPENLAEVAAAGAHGAAGIRAFQDVGRLADLVKAVSRAWPEKAA